MRSCAHNVMEQRENIKNVEVFRNKYFSPARTSMAKKVASNFVKNITVQKCADA